MAVKYKCSSCGATMTLASLVNTVKCPVCRLDMAPVAETEAAIPRTPPVAKPVVPAPSASASASGTTMPPGIKIARPASERGGQNVSPVGESAPATSSSQTGPSADTAAHKLMADARAEADRIIQDAQRQREEILDHAEAHAKQQVEEYFDAARREAAEMESKARAEADKLLAEAKAKAQAESDKRIAAVAKAPTPAETGESAAAPGETEVPPPPPATESAPSAPLATAAQTAPGSDVETAIQAAVEQALREERKKVAQAPKAAAVAPDVGPRPDAKRETRLILLAGGFALLVLLGCLASLIAPPSAARNLTLALLVLTLGMLALLVVATRAGGTRKTRARQRDGAKRKGKVDAAQPKTETQPPPARAADAPEKSSPRPAAADTPQEKLATPPKPEAPEKPDSSTKPAPRTKPDTSEKTAPTGGEASAKAPPATTSGEAKKSAPANKLKLKPQSDALRKAAQRAAKGASARR